MRTNVDRTGRLRRPAVAMVMLGTALALAPTSTRAETLRAETDSRIVADLGRYCTACWRNARLAADRWGDCTQDVFRRLLERVPPSAWQRALREDGTERVELLRAIDAVKKRAQRERRHSGSVDHLADRREPVARKLVDERAAVDCAANQVLSGRQQLILRRSFEGWSVQDIASELRLPPARISDEKYKAIHRLRDALRDHQET